MADIQQHQDTVEEMAVEYADSHDANWYDSYNAFTAGAEWALSEVQQRVAEMGVTA